MVYIESRFADGTTASGCGAVVGTNDILTASHVIDSPSNGGKATEVTVYPALDGRDEPFGSLAVQTTNFFPIDEDGFLLPSESEKDLAILGLATDIVSTTGLFQIDPA